MENKENLQEQQFNEPQNMQQQTGTQNNKEANIESGPGGNNLVQQDQPLKNNDRDVDPSDPRHSSLEHR